MTKNTPDYWRHMLYGCRILLEQARAEVKAIEAREREYLAKLARAEREGRGRSLFDTSEGQS